MGTIDEKGDGMGYETKVILVAVADIIKTSKTLDEAFERVAKIANAEGVVVDSMKDDKNKEEN
jgi:hypothetical protein